MLRVWGAWIAALLAVSLPLAAKDATPLVLPKGARVGVIDLLDTEITHFHSAKSLRDQFLKAEIVAWPTQTMLMDALKERATQLGLALVAVPLSDELDHSREPCFVNGNFNKGLPKDCVAPLEHVLANNLQAVIVLAPGLNNSAHGGSARRKELPDFLRGWGFVTGEAAGSDGHPSLFSMTELIMVGPSSEGLNMGAREWGGGYTMEWTTFNPPADLKEIPSQDYALLQPMFGALLTRQADRLLSQVQPAP